MKHALVVVLLAACGPKVSHKPDTEPDLSSWAKWDRATQTGQRPVTVGTPLGIMVNWHGWCEHSSMAPRIDSGGNNEYPCKFVDHQIAVRCANDACRLERTEYSYAYQIIPTKLGEMRATVVVSGKYTNKSKRFELEPVMVVVPNAARANCFPPSSFAISLFHDEDELDQAEPGLVKLKGGAACTPGSYVSCPVQANGPVELEVSGNGYALTTTADCS